MALLQPRFDTSSLASVPDTLSSWDKCMDKTWCKWPVIVGIIIGSLIIISIIWCCVRCLCCGLQCCCGIFSCCNACCPGPRRREKGYQQAPPTPYHNQYQYQQPPPMNPPPMNPYFASGGAGGYKSANVAQTASFDSPSKDHKVNDDALPAMPSWSNATSRKVEQPHEQEDVEMDKMNRVTPPVSPTEHQQQATLAKGNDNLSYDRYYGRTTDSQYAHSRDPINANNGQPYHDYSAHQQFSPDPYESTHGMLAAHGGYYGGDNRAASPYSPHEQHYSNGQTTGVVSGARNGPSNPANYGNGGHSSPLSYAATDGEFYEPQCQQPTAYGQQGHQYPPQSPYQQPASYAQPKPYESTVPPSYRTQQPNEIASPISPPPLLTPGGGNFGRKPVGGNWREV